MRMRIAIILASVLGVLLSSCGLTFNEDKHAENRVKAIVSALESEDAQMLESLFSKRALDEANDLDSQFEFLFSFLEGDIISWENGNGKAGDTSSENGKKAVMLRYGFSVVTDIDRYSFFLIDYAVNSIDPDNEGLYMLEVCRESYDGGWEAWQDRMKAGVSIVE